MNKWYTYIVRCSDDTLYCGITNDLEKRIKAHNEGKGAKYTKGRGPVEIEIYFERESHSEAAKLEYEIKQMSRKEKEEFIKRHK